MAAVATTGNWQRSTSPVIVTGSPADPIDQQSADQAKRVKQEEMLQLARERFRDSITAESLRRLEMIEDQKFRCGIQWDPAIVAIRAAQDRPCLTINRTDGFVAHVVNDMRQSRPGIKIDPIAGGADEEIAEIRQGLIRHIELNSRADIAYDTGFENMACMGLGYLRVVDFREPKSFRDLDLKVEWISNIFTVYEDPAASKPDWSDGEYRFVVEDISLGEARRRFGKEFSPVSLGEFSSIGDQQNNWIIGGKVRIAEYFHVEDEPDVLNELDDETTIWDSELSELEDDEFAAISARIMNSRPDVRKKVYWTLMHGLGVIKERVWPGRYIPIIPVIGNQTYLEGEMLLSGMVRYAREAQRMFNFMYSCFVEACALAPKAPFIAEFSQIEEFQDLWKRANTDIQAFLPYKAQSVNQNLIPPPRRETSEPPIQAFVEGLKLADQNLKSVFRIFEASLGQRGPQESGIAINSRKVESDLSTYNWADNFNRALQFLGIVLNDLLEHYYNRPGRVVQIIQEDLTKKSTTFNQLHEVDGEQKFYDLRQGKFAVTVSTGPAFNTRRQEASKAMLELAKVYPPLMQVAGPQIVSSMDWPDKDVIADQLEKAMPPELRRQKDDDKQNSAEKLTQTQQQLAQMQDMVKQLTEALHQASDQKEMVRMKEEFATFRTEITANASIAVADLKVSVDQSMALSAEIFEEMKRTRAILEGQLVPAQPDKTSSSDSVAPASAAAPQPQAPAQPQVPPPGANTPAEVGFGT